MSFTVLDTLATIARRMHPPHLRQLVEALTAPANALRSAVSQEDRTHAPGTPMLAWEPVRPAVSLALQACDELAAAPAADNPMLAAYRAMRRYSGVQEMLAELAPTLPAISRHLLEPSQRDDPELLRRLAAPANPDTEVFHFNNETQGRGGFSVYVPPSYDPVRPCPVVAGKFVHEDDGGAGAAFLEVQADTVIGRRVRHGAAPASGGRRILRDHAPEARGRRSGAWRHSDLLPAG